MKKYLLGAAISLSSFLVLTATVSAQIDPRAVKAAGSIMTFSALIDIFTQTIVKSLGMLAMASAMVAFFYGVVQYIWGARAGDATKIKNGNQFMIWGLIALFVMFSVYGIVRFAQNFICSGDECTKITIPELNFGRSGATGGAGGGQTGNGSPLNPSTGGGGRPGNGTPVLGGSSNGSGSPYAGQTGNSAFDDCIANGGGVVECRRTSGSSGGGSSGSSGAPSTYCQAYRPCIIPGTTDTGNCSSDGSSCEAGYDQYNEYPSTQPAPVSTDGGQPTSAGGESTGSAACALISGARTCVEEGCVWNAGDDSCE